MAITNGQTATAADFVSTSAGAGDSGKSTKLNASGVLDYTFLTDAGLISITAGENASAGQTATIGDAGAVAGNTVGTTGSTTAYSSTTWLSQNVTTTAFAIAIYSVRIGLANNSKNVTLRIYAIDGSNKPTGSVLGSATITSTNGSNTDEFIFSSPVTVSPSTTYAVVISTTTTDSWVRGATDNTGGISTDSGATWTMDKGNFQTAVKEIHTVAGRVYRGDANRDGSTASSFSENYIGIFEAAATAGNAVLVRVSGISTKVSGLTAGNIYYLSDTEGSLSATPGTISRKAGIALSATTLLIKHDNT